MKARKIGNQSRRQSRGFTLTELLIVIGIIAILAGILLPTISNVRKAGARTRSAAIISNLSSAIQRYSQEFGAFPGPYRNNQIRPLDMNGYTMAENLVLGLVGGLYVDGTNTVQFDANLVGGGPKNLNLAAGKINRQYPPYVEGAPLSQAGAQFTDGAGTANDTRVPEFLDGYTDPLPVLYLRANTGVRSLQTPNAQKSLNNNVCTDYDPSIPTSILGQYDLSQLTPYTKTTIGVGKDASKQSKYTNSAAYPAHGLRSVQPNLLFSIQKNPPANLAYAYPYDAYALLGNPSYLDTSTNPPKFSEPRQRDGFILIGAGPDRIYGTEDDIFSFGTLE